MIREMSKIFKYTRGGFRFLILLLLRCPFDALLTVTQASFLQYAFNAIQQNSKDRLNIVCIAFGIASLFLFLYNGIVWSCYASFVVKTEGKLRNKMFGKISSVSLSQIEAKQHGEWITRLNTDVQMPFSKPMHIPHAACAFVSICVSACILLYINPSIFWLVMLFVIPHILISQFFIAKPMTALAKKSLEATDQNTTDLNAFITCADIAIMYDAKDFLMKRFEESSLHLRSVNMKMRNRNAISGAILPLFGMGGYLLILIVGSLWIANGTLTFGELIAAFQYRGGVLVGSLMLINCLISIKTSIAGIQRVNETMEMKSEESYG
jgi:ABC-type bacteriocin/lantibiotic exporter with double-glycine peptidase domain